MSNDLSGKVGLDTTEFKRGISQLDASIKSMETSFRASAAVMDNWSGTSTGLKERISSLSQILEAQKSKLQILKDEYDKVVASQGADSKAAESLAGKMFSAEKAISSTESSLSKYSAKLKTVEEQEKSSTGLGKLKTAFIGLAEQSKKSTSSISSHFSNLKSSIMGAVAGIGISLGATGLAKNIYDMAASASDLAEAQNVVENTFKRSAKAVEDWTDTTAASAGIGKTAATSMVGSMGAMMKSSGITEKAAMSMSEKLVQLTGDMSSFYNVSTNDMWEKIRAGISGETEPLKQLGINMSVANLQAYALAEGIKKPYKEMSQAEQTTLRYNYLMKVTADAQGDFARTSSNSMANQSRIFQMNIENMKQTVGSAFLPMINTMFNALNPFIQSIIPKLSSSATKFASLISGIFKDFKSDFAATGEISTSIALVLDQYVGKTAGDAFMTLYNAAQTAIGIIKSIFGFIEGHGSLVEGAIIGIVGAVGLWKATVLAANVVQEISNALTIANAIATDGLAAGQTALTAAKGGTTLATIALNAATIGSTVSIIAHTVALGAAKAAMAVATAAQWAFNAALSANPIGIVVVAIAGLVAAFILLWKNCAGFRNFWIGMWDGIKSGAQATGSWFSGPFVNFFKATGNGIKSFFTGMPGFFSNLWNGVKATTQTVWNGIKSFFTGIWNGIKAIFATITDIFAKPINAIKGIILSVEQVFTGLISFFKTAILGGFLLVLDAITGLFTGNFTKLNSDTGKLGNALKNILHDIWEGIKGIFVSYLDFIRTTASIIWSGTVNAGKSIWNGFKSFMAVLWNGIKQVAVSAWNGIKSFFSSAWNGMVNTGKSIWNGFKAFFTSLWSGLVSFIRELPGKFSSGVRNIGSAIVSGFNSAISFLRDLPSRMLEWGEDMIQGLIRGIKNKISSVGSAVSSIGDKIRSYLHFSTPDEGPLRDYETWMPDMIEGMRKGILNNVGRLKSAAINAASALSGELKANINIGGASGTGVSSSTVTNNNSSPTFYITINAAGADVSKQQDMAALAKVLSNQIALTTMRRRAAW